MPYFKWTGVDGVGSTKKGKKSAYSLQDLSETLLHQGIALLQCKIIYAPPFLWPITSNVKGSLFRQKAKLLRAGILLPKAFTVVAQQSHNPIVCDMLFSISRDIQHGVSFVKALEKHPKLSDPIVMVMLAAGHESGNIVNAMETVACYFHKQHLFNRSVRSALAMPLVTLLFFIGITVFIFVFIIPRFADMFASLQQELPALTRSMISLSNFVRSDSMMYVLVFFGVMLFIVHYYFTHSGKTVWDAAVVKMPFIGVVMWQYQMSQALQALSLLIKSGVTLVTGLKIVSESVDNVLVRSYFVALHDDVSSGQLLSSAMAIQSVFLPEVIALVLIGQETGSLGQSLENAALLYSDTLEEQLRRFVFFLQPVVIVLLGLLVTTLIFSVYLPIMQLSHVL